MNTKLIARILLAAMLLTVMAVPAMAADCVFNFNISDGSHEITLSLGDVVTVYLDCYVPDRCVGHEMAVLFDPNAVECLDVTENTSVTDWMLWEFRDVYTATDPKLSYMNFDALHFGGVCEPNSTVRCGDMSIKAVSPGLTTLYLGMYPGDIPNIDHGTSIGCDAGEFDWVYAAATFEITVVDSPRNFTKPLPLGWNLISLPLTPSDNSTSTILGGVSYSVVYRYDATSKQFECPSTMDPGIGYFVDVTSASTWEYEGMPVSSTSPGLKSGLNMIGVPNCTMSVNDPDAMGSADYRYVARWNAADQEFEVYNPSAPAVFHHFDTMAAGEGYFVSAGSDDDTFAISCP